MALIRLVVFGFIALSVVYFALSWYSRSLRREKLENDWADDQPDQLDGEARDSFIADGMTEYEGGLRKKLIWLVYILPTVLVIGILFVTNSN